MKDWADLPVSAQVRRIRGALADVLPRWGMRDAELRFIFHGENTTFRAHTRRGDFLVRVARPGYHTISETLSELAWLTDLHAGGIACPNPVASRDGELVIALDEPGVGASHVCVFEWVEGTIVGRRLGRSTITAIGELMARLHEHAAGWKRPRGFDRTGWLVMTGQQPTPETQATWKLLPAEHRREFQAIRRAAMRAYESLSHPRDIGLLHADLHSRNVLHTSDGIAAIDFDDTGFAPWVTDLAVASAYWNERQTERMGWMLEGYHRVREFPAHQLQHLPTLIAWRIVGVTLWATARSQSNAFFRKRLKSLQDAMLKMAREARARTCT
ncbi:MAG: phosphotransferase [Planctomycetes bacterium]|nr:phosphotransferase [Planctomycetota bacterium]